MKIKFDPLSGRFRDVYNIGSGQTHPQLYRYLRPLEERFHQARGAQAQQMFLQQD
jgi:hypothetical protein